MNDDDLDQRLSRAGEAWRASQALPAVEVPAVRPRPAWVLPVAAAASVALLAGGVTLAATQLDRDDRSDPPPAASKGERWHPDLPPGVGPTAVPGAVPPVPQEVSYPAAEAAGTYTPRVFEAAGAPDCRGQDVRLDLEPAGPGEMRLVLSAKGDDVRCATGYRPNVQFRKDGKYVEVLEQQSDPRAGDWPSSVLVTTGQRAMTLSRWIGWCAGEGPEVDTVEVIDSDWSVMLPMPERAPCPVTDFEDDKLHLPFWSPEGFTFEPRESFGPIAARVVDRVEGPAGLPTWVVELTARRDVFLDTCPSWQVRQGDEEAGSWRLNCDGVPDHKDDGRPYLPAGEPVRFAIWVPYGDSQAPLIWVLRTPQGSVSVLLSSGPAAPTGAPRIVDENKANVHLFLSIFDEPLRFSISIDGSPVLSDARVEDGGSGIRAFHLAVPAGDHAVVIRTDSGLRRAVTLRVRDQGDLWAAADQVGTPSDRTGGSIEWRVQDTPMFFG